MTDNAENVIWPAEVQEKFDLMIAKIPPFLRTIAKTKVSSKAQSLAYKSNRREVSEKDIVDAFFLETPFGFHGPMKTDMAELGLDYMKYGYEK